MNRRDGRIDGLRGIAALTVVLPHLALLLLDGESGNSVASLWPGLALLFVLSGYLLYRPFVVSVLRDDVRPDLPSFLRNRLLRLVPAAAVVLVAALVLRVPFAPDPWLLLPIPAFAVVLPLLWLGARMLDDGHHQVQALSIPAVLVLCAGLSGHVLEDGQALLALAAPFGLGMLAAVTTEAVTARRTLRRQVWAVRRGALLVLLAAAVVAVPATARGLESTVLGLAGAAMIVLVRLPGRGLRDWLAAMFDLPPLRRAGVVSTGLVLWHYPLTMAWLEHRPDGLPDEPLVTLAVGISLVTLTWLLAEATYRWVELPALERRTRTIRRRPRASALRPEQMIEADLVLPRPRDGGRHRADLHTESPQRTSPSR